MKSSTLTIVLVRLTTALALVAPLVIFGFLYVLGIQPHRAAASAARQQLEEAEAHLSRGRTPAGLAADEPTANKTAATKSEVRTADIDDPSVAKSISELLSGPGVGGVTNLSIQAGEVAYAPLTINFDARYDQISRFLRNLRTLPTTVELRSVELTQRRDTSMHAEIVLLEWSRNVPTSEVKQLTASPEPRPPIRARRARVAPPAPDPTVTSILFSSGRRVALIDGRIVEAGDRVGPATVQSIDADGVVIVRADGEVRRLGLGRPVIRSQRQ